MVTTAISNLSHDLLVKIFQYLSAEDLVDNITSTCRLWRSLCDRPDVWTAITYTPPPTRREADLVNYLKRMPLLQSLHLEHYLNGDVILSTLIKHCFHIRQVEMHFKRGPTIQMVIQMILHFPHMEKLEASLPDRRMCIDFAKLYCHVPSQKKLTLTVMKSSFRYQWYVHYRLIQLLFAPLHATTPLGHIQLELGKRKDTLESLGLECLITKEILREVFTCTQLRYLYILNERKESISLLNVSFTNLKNLETLQLIRIENCLDTKWPYVPNEQLFLRLTRLEVVQGSGKFVSFLIRISPMLKHLNLQACELKDVDLLNISLCKHLEYLDVSGNPNLSNRFIIYYGYGCCKLKFLDISDCTGIDDDVIIYLQPFIELETLIIEGILFKGDHFHKIPQLLPSIVEFNVKHFFDDDCLYRLAGQKPGLRILKTNLVISKRFNFNQELHLDSWHTF